MSRVQTLLIFVRPAEFNTFLKLILSSSLIVIFFFFGSSNSQYLNQICSITSVLSNITFLALYWPQPECDYFIPKEKNSRLFLRKGKGVRVRRVARHYIACSDCRWGLNIWTKSFVWIYIYIYIWIRIFWTYIVNYKVITMIELKNST
jgi:hypothetical protein